MIELTENAVAAVRQVVSKSDSATGLRLMVSEGGCAGVVYRMGLEAAAQDGDEVLEFEDVKVFVDGASTPLLSGVRVDFVDKIAGAGFVFENPNAVDKCSCGKSFSAPAC
ncbi:MAG: HesB/IscA family protein [Rhodospirillaceae bacterium]